MKIIALNSAKNGKKDIVARKLAMNSDVVYVKPYTDKPIPINAEEYEQDEYIHLNVKQLADKMEREVPACYCDIGDSRYVYFENQFNSNFVVLVLDDECLKTVKEKYGSNVVSVRVKSASEEPSQRSGNLRDSFFDIVYDYDSDDYDTFEGGLEWYLR